MRKFNVTLFNYLDFDMIYPLLSINLRAKNKQSAQKKAIEILNKKFNIIADIYAIAKEI